MGGLPPVVRLAAALAAGATLGPHLGRAAPALLVLLLPLPPIQTWLRPTPARGALLLAFVAGALSAALAAHPRGCVPPAKGGARVVLEGYFVADGRGRPAPFMVTGRCRTEVRALARPMEPGRPVRLSGRWLEGPRDLFVAADSVLPLPTYRSDVRALAVRWRGHLVARIGALYGERAPVVAALTLARKEGLDPALREAFARSGIAHLLAISGFHVGVVALLALTLLRTMGLRPRRAALVSATLTWIYVGLLGFPDAACRAALILTAVAASRLRGRPPARWGPLGAALLILVALDPRRMGSPGFQLSFAGAAGLTAWSAPIAAALRRRIPYLGDTAASAVAAGVSATLATLPIVAWHFERISLVGIPATLVASPFVALALPGALASLAADAVHPGLGAFLAGGVDMLLMALLAVTRWLASPAWASVWVPRSWVPVAALGGVLASASLGTRVRARARRGVVLSGACAAVLAWPALLVFQGRGTLEIVTVDVGQGDAIAVRTPGGRWLLVDAGPPRSEDPGAAPVVRELRRRGVRRLEALVLTHPDLDHVGGAEAVLRSFDVGTVLDPSRATGKDAYLTLLETAAARGVPWRRAERGQRFEIDGVSFEVLSPGPPDEVTAADGTESNAVSVVMIVRYGALDVLLTGDAPTSVERDVLARVGTDLEVLKVGHHGSATSTDSLLLASAHPLLALLSVGRGNRYGHPAPEVLSRLEHAGVEIHRTDREGTIRVLGRRDGSFIVR